MFLRRRTASVLGLWFSLSLPWISLASKTAVKVTNEDKFPSPRIVILVRIQVKIMFNSYNF